MKNVIGSTKHLFRIFLMTTISQYRTLIPRKPNFCQRFRENVTPFIWLTQSLDE